MVERKGKRGKGARVPPSSSTPKLRIAGNVVIAPLSRVKPNTWNPNQMTEFLRESTKRGLVEDGWVAAYALLVWGKDEKGKRRDIIIDGEHRWELASELGFTEGPMVFLDGLTEKQAREMTIKFDAKRGKFDDLRLADLIRSIAEPGDADLGMRLGFDDVALAALMDVTPTLPPSEFREVSIDAQTSYCCPKCGYEWNGAPSRSKQAAE